MQRQDGLLQPVARRRRRRRQAGEFGAGGVLPLQPPLQVPQQLQQARHVQAVLALQIGVQSRSLLQRVQILRLEVQGVQEPPQGLHGVRHPRLGRLQEGLDLGQPVALPGHGAQRSGRAGQLLARRPVRAVQARQGRGGPRLQGAGVPKHAQPLGQVGRLLLAQARLRQLLRLVAP